MIWALPRAAGILTFKAEAPRTTEECLEDIVGIKICGAEKQGTNKQVRKAEGSEEELPVTEKGTPEPSQTVSFPRLPASQNGGEPPRPTLCKAYSKPDPIPGLRSLPSPSAVSEEGVLFLHPLHWPSFSTTWNANCTC